ncbi:MAG: DUF885 family protein, partial [Pseudomonadota bacterium]
MTRTRHGLLGLALVLGAAIGLVACGADPNNPSRQVTNQSEELFDTLARMEISSTPETLTQLGLPSDLLDVETNGRIGDRSQAAFERLRLRRIEALKLLEEITLAPEGSELRGHQVMVLRTYNNAVRVGEFGHGRVGLGNAYPYVADHRSGAWIDLPNLLVARQRVSDLADAQAFLARIAQVAGAVEDERLRLLADVDAGIVPPRFVLDALKTRLAEDAAIPVETDRIVLAFEDQVSGLINETAESRQALRREALTLLREKVRPSLSEFAATIDDLSQRASDVPGVWTLPDGDAYYDAVLAMHTRADTSAESLHREARARVDALSQEIEAALDALAEVQAAEGEIEAAQTVAMLPPAKDDEGAVPADMPETVGARLAALAAQEDQSYTDTPEGR